MDLFLQTNRVLGNPGLLILAGLILFWIIRYFTTPARWSSENELNADPVVVRFPNGDECGRAAAILKDLRKDSRYTGLSFKILFDPCGIIMGRAMAEDHFPTQIHIPLDDDEASDDWADDTRNDEAIP